MSGADQTVARCDWVGKETIYIDYHDREWGIPNGDSQSLFEKIVLEGFQAGLSWITILRKREHFRTVFDQFDADAIARYGPRKIASLLDDPGIVRNRLKIEATIQNAKAYLALSEHESFSTFLWNFVDGQPIQNNHAQMSDVPGSTELSKQISKELKKRGFRFVGPTTVYAMMQAAGLVNDHLTSCHRHKACAGLKPKLS